MKLCNSFQISPNELLIFKYNASKNELTGKIADLLKDCKEDELRKIIEYIHFVKK